MTAPDLVTDELVLTGRLTTASNATSSMRPFVASAIFAWRSGSRESKAKSAPPFVRART